MRHWLILLTSITLVLSAQVGRAQSPPDRPVDVGGFFSLDTDVGRINGSGAVLSGAEIGLLLDHRFSLAFSGLALVSDDDDDDSPTAPSDRLRFGYGGVSLGYIVAPASRIHFLVDVLIGGGSVRPRPIVEPDGDGDRLFVAQPSIAAEVNLSRHIRAALGISYRAASGVDTTGLSNADLRGFAVRLAIKAGKF